MARVPRNALPAILLGSCALLALACTTPTELSEQMLPSLQAGDNTVALEILDENAEDYGEDNAFLYLIERGMVLHYAGRWQESNQSFERAKRVAEEHYTKSLTQEASTFLVNDNSRPYYGENFERALLQVFGALNYNELGDTEGALVEVRQLSFFLRQLDLEAENTLTYRDDAFARYLAGIFFAERGEHDQAFVAYKKALDLYKHYEKEYRVSTPGMLVTDAALTARELGSWAERELEAKVGRYEVPERRPGTGQAVVLHYNGRAPYKIDTFIDIAFGDGWVYVNHVKADGEAKKDFAKASGYATAIMATEQVRVAFPEYRSVPKTIRFMEVTAPGAGTPVRAQLAENVGAIAEQDLADRIVRIRAKAIARAVIKYALAKGAQEAARTAGGNEYGNLAAALMGVAGNIARNATEVADKRAWFTVPEEIWVAEIQLAAGDHTLDVRFFDARGAELSRRQVPVSIEAGARTFVTVRTME